MITETYPDLYQEYSNIERLAASRSDIILNWNVRTVSNRKAVTNQNKKMNASEFEEYMTSGSGFIVVALLGKESRQSGYVILFAPDSPYIRETAKLKNLISVILAVTGPATRLPDIMMFYGSEIDLTDVSEYNNRATFFQHHYRVLRMCIMDHVIMPECKIIHDKSKLLYINEKNLAYIKHDDPIKIWMGLCKGDVVMLLYKSEIAGSDTEYRLIL